MLNFDWRMISTIFPIRVSPESSRSRGTPHRIFRRRQGENDGFVKRAILVIKWAIQEDLPGVGLGKLHAPAVPAALLDFLDFTGESVTSCPDSLPEDRAAIFRAHRAATAFWIFFRETFPFP
jgi:hypothetical protein